jgi:hypothetical protein
MTVSCMACPQADVMTVGPKSTRSGRHVRVQRAGNYSRTLPSRIRRKVGSDEVLVLATLITRTHGIPCGKQFVAPISIHCTENNLARGPYPNSWGNRKARLRVISLLPKPSSPKKSQLPPAISHSPNQSALFREDQPIQPPANQGHESSEALRTKDGG